MLELWHGGRRWEGDPEVRPPKKGRYECGPGIYLTNQYDRAYKYAKGGGVTTRVTLSDGVRWLEDAKLPLAVLQDYVRTARGMRQKVSILEDLQRCSDRESTELISVSRLVNLCINHEAVAGQQGVQLANWLVAQGIDASLHSVNGAEQWVIVFNPKVIRRHRAVSASAINGADRDFQLVTVQLAASAE